MQQHRCAPHVAYDESLVIRESERLRAAARQGLGGWRPPRRRLLSLLTHNLTTYTYLVDPASSYMLVSKIKPCMCQYRPL